MSSLTFTLFADFHYKKGMYASTIPHMEKILDRADDSGSQFVIHCGDFCNDYTGSPELMRAYLENPRNISVYGVYGNHELEGPNSMAEVTPLLCNRPVVWGTHDGSIGDGSIAYYYFDEGEFRIIGLDTNYSYSESAGEWQHNTTWSWGPPKGNIKVNSLGPAQLAWLESVLSDAADKGLHCLLFSHASYCSAWRHYEESVRLHPMLTAANARRAGTVFAMFNGHYHTNHMTVLDSIFYHDVNTVINGAWAPRHTHHYLPGMTFDFDDYDKSGAYLGTRRRELIELSQAKNSWFFNDPLSAVVTVTTDGKITVKGASTSWMYGIEPRELDYEGAVPEISDVSVKL